MKFDLAEVKEREGAKSGEYPPNWPEVARHVKEAAGWKCERCGHPHDYENGYTLTVHHLDGRKWNLALWNLAPLCQRCHLKIQAKVDWWQQLLDGKHSPWMVRHIRLYNEWAKEHGLKEHELDKKQLTLV